MAIESAGLSQNPISAQNVREKVPATSTPAPRADDYPRPDSGLERIISPFDDDAHNIRLTQAGSFEKTDLLILHFLLYHILFGSALYRFMTCLLLLTTWLSF